MMLSRDFSKSPYYAILELAILWFLVVEVLSEKTNLKKAQTRVSHECPPVHSTQTGQKRQRKIAIKVVDIFGNDTMKVVEVTV